MRITRRHLLLPLAAPALVLSSCGTTTDTPGSASPNQRDAPGSARAGSAAQLLRDADVSLTPTPCDLAVPETTTCGTADVPSDWSVSDSNTTEVFYALLPAQDGPSEGTVIPFMGGPGESITAVIDRFVPFAESLPDRDTLIVDVRGAGRSDPLTCPAFEKATEFAAGEEQVRQVGECGQQLGARRNDYTTAASVMDIESIRRALDLEPPSVIGFSYGTWMAQVYTHLFPDEVRGAVLDGAFPIDQDAWAEDVPNSFESVLELRCERTAACPDGAQAVAASIQEVAGDLDAQPVDLVDSSQDLTEGVFASILQFALQGEDLAAVVSTVESAASGDYEALAAVASDALRIPSHDMGAFSPALGAAVSCNDYVAPFDLSDDLEERRADYDRRVEQLPADAFGWFSPRGWLESPWEQGDMCLDWPTPDIAAELRAPRDEPGPDVPVLVVNGDLDPPDPARRCEEGDSSLPEQRAGRGAERRARRVPGQRLRGRPRDRLPARADPAHGRRLRRRAGTRVTHPGEIRWWGRPAHPVRVEDRAMAPAPRYEIEIRGRATERILRPVLDDFQISLTGHGTTLLVGEVRDASHLHGLLVHFTSMNVEVVELRRLDAPGVPDPSTQQ